jgi:sugar/nucleoside kinase (ribokinase family)
MNFWVANKKNQLLKVLKKVDLLLVNESEGRQLTGERNIIKVGRAIEKLGPKKVIIKKGEHGAVLFNGKDVSSIPGFLLEEVYDPTGAGDTYAGAAIGYLATCKTISNGHFRNSAIYGNIMATFTIEDFSVKKIATVTKSVFNKRLNLFKKYSAL